MIMKKSIFYLAVMFMCLNLTPQTNDKPYNLAVSAVKMNVFYIGVDNPVDIAVSGIPEENLKVSITGGTISKDEKGKGWIVKCKSDQAGQAVITVSADINGEIKPVGTRMFKVKRVPDPVTFIAGIDGGLISRDTLINGSITTSWDDFDFELSFKVTSFNVSAVIGGDVIDIPIKGNMLSEKAKSTIRKMEKDSRIYIEEIKAIGPDGEERKLNAIPLILSD